MPSESTAVPETLLGPVELAAIAHGGHCVARVDGRVIFVRHGIPDEQVTIRVIDDSKPRFWWGEVAEVVAASDDRVAPPCPVAGRCGGCDFQHVALPRQLELKAQVVAEQLRRLAGIDWTVIVESVPGDNEGLGWRTRMRYLVRDGRVGLRAWRSDAPVELPVGGCPIAHPAGPDDLARWARDDGELQVVVASDQTTVLGVDGEPVQGTAIVRQQVGSRWFRVRADGFWQVHPGAPEALVDAVMRLGGPGVGEAWWDLYSGAGLFAAFLGEAVGPDGEVDAVESDQDAHRDARRALHDLRQVRLHAADVATWLRTAPGRPDGVVLDPPRAGAGAAVVEEIAERAVERIVYVACDPAALARDVALLRARGYRLAAIEGYDAFPMTHHVEAAALLVHEG